MRCPKCGYISFDHLVTCNKCSRDLGDSRETLNLQDFEPQVPFLLGSLVGEMQGGGHQQQLSITQQTELELGGLEVSEESGLEATVDVGNFGGELEVDSTEELKLSEIDLDALEGLEETDALDAGVNEVELEDLGELDVGSTEEDEGFLGLEFETEEAAANDLGAFEDTLAADPAAGSSGDDLELDLSEDDLSELAKTLEGQLDEETGGIKKAMGGESSPELDEVILELEDE